MKKKPITIAINVLFGLSFLLAILLLTNRTYGIRTLIHLGYFIFGASGLILSLLSSRLGWDKEEFNILFWFGNLGVFIGLVFKTYGWSYDQYILIAGMALTSFSYFCNPSSADDEEEGIID